MIDRRSARPRQEAAIAVVGELNVDLILERVNQLPEIGKERVAKGMVMTLGSSSAILAANASAIGVAVRFVGCVGVDSFGAFVLERLEQRGVDTQRVIRRSDLPTGLTVIYTHEGDRGSFTYPGAMEHLTTDDVPWDYVSGAKHLHVSSFYLQPGLQEGCREMFRRAKEAGLSTSLDTNWDPAEKWDGGVLEVLDEVDVFLPNDDEARLISGEQDLDRAIALLAERAGTVVATCGAAGVRARTGVTAFEIPAYSVDPVDAVGAGDSFNAGFLSRYVRGDDIETCLRFGALTGAFSTTAAGGTTAFDDIDAFIRFARRHGVSDQLLDRNTVRKIER